MSANRPFEGLDPKRPFVVTGGPTAPEYRDIPIMHGPVYADTELFYVFCDALRLLRACIPRIRGLRDIKDETIDAFVQLLGASALLAANEAQALLALVTTGLAAPSRIHLRALGEVALRVRIFRSDLPFGLQVYRSYIASQLIVAKGVLPDDHHLVERLNELFDAEFAKTDRKLTGNIHASASGTAEISKGESDSWSKWSHGEITALAEIARRLEQNPDVEIEEAAGNDGQGPFYLFRGAVFLWLLLLSFAIVVDIEEPARDLMARIKTAGKPFGWTE